MAATYDHIHNETNQNVYAALRDRFFRHKNNIAIKTDGGREYSYRDLDNQTARMAAALRALGVAKGDRLAGLVDKSAEAIFLYLAATRVGMIFVPMNTAFRPSEVEYILKDATPTVIVCAPQHENNVRGVARGAAAAPHVFTLDESGGGSFMEQALAIEPDDALEEGSAADTHALVYTSGTTGRPKGAMLTNGLVTWNVLTLSELWGFRPDDVLIHTNPFAYSLFGTTNVALAAASTMVLLPKFSVEEIVDRLPTATVFLGVPTHYARLLNARGFTKEACSNIRLFVTGSAPMRADIFAEFEQRTGHRLVDRYGLTENLIFTSAPLDGPRIEGTSGLPLPGVDVRLIDSDQRAVADGQVGTILVKGPYSFNGYWGDREKTKRSYTDDGYLITGDFGIRHPNGYISILGRGVDLIISGGLNVFPKEIEEHVNALPNIKESAAIGVPHPDFGEAVVAVVELRDPEAGVDEQALIGALKAEMAGYKVPKRIVAIARMPRTALGKIQKNILKSEYSALFPIQIKLSDEPRKAGMNPFEIITTRHNGIATITLSREARLNAWKSDDRARLGAVLAELRDDDQIQGIVLTGAGTRAFCAGQDFEETKAYAGGAQGHKWLRDVKAFYEIIRSIDKPTVAALNGTAAGSGFQFALLMDFRVAHAAVRLGQPEVNSGIPSVVGPWVMQQHMSVGASLDLALSGRLITADEALKLGLVNEIVEPQAVLPRAQALARQLADQPPNAFKLTKQGFRHATQTSFDAAFEFADTAQTAAFENGEPQRMMEKFLAVRAARKAG